MQMSETDKKTAVVLGGTVPHGELIRELKERGYRTVLVDYFDDPPAAEFADIHCKESAMDYDAVYNIAKQYHADIVLSSCLDQQMNVAMKTAERLDLPHPFSADTAEKVTNKRLMKKIMMDNDIPTARYYVVSQDTDISELDLAQEVIVKPADSCGSAGISRVAFAEKEKLQEAVNKACGFGLSGKAIVEDFIEGTEMGVHGYRKDGIFHLILSTCKISVIDGNMTRQLCNAYFPKLNRVLEKKLLEIATQIGDAFELPDNTPFFMQVIVRDDEVYVIEFSPRVAGGTSSMVAKEYAGFDMLSYSIDSYLGKTGDSNDSARLEKYVICFPIFASEGVLDQICGIEKSMAENIVSDVIILKKQGDQITGDKPSSCNVLKYLIAADSVEECLHKLKIADEYTDVLDDKGVSIRIGKNELTSKLFMEKTSVLL